MSATVNDITSLNNAIVNADGVATAGTITITLGTNIALGTTALEAFNLAPGVVVDLIGNGFTLDGGDSQRGLFVYAGSVDVSNLALNDFLAQGGAGAAGGGGGAGLGGALFIGANVAGDAGNVTLSGVSFSGDAAAGGAGADDANGDGYFGGGGGLGGNAGTGYFSGGGGIGGDGGAGLGEAGSAGIVPGAGAGGTGSEGLSGGDDGGGGGGATTPDTTSGTGTSPLVGGGGGGGDESNEGGGDGGFGGGGGGAGGAGGFGGGGGFGNTGGAGGFGGGGGGAATAGGAGAGGFGGGVGGYNNGGGGGGLGAGGDIFIQQGAQLSIGGTDIVGSGTVSGGGSGDTPGPANGQAFGDGIFIQGNQTITLNSGAGSTITIDGQIADQTGAYLAAGLGTPTGTSADGTPNAGSGGLLLNGPGTVVLADATNDFTGGIVLNSGTLDLAAPESAGSGTITFGGNAELVIGAGSTGQPSSTLDLRGISLSSQKFFAGGTLTSGGDVVVAAAGGANFEVTSDGQGGSLLFDLSPPSIGGVSASQNVYDIGTINPFKSVLISDANSPSATETVTVALSSGTANSGTLTDPNAATDNSTFANGVYTLFGTSSQVTTDLAGLVFTPTAGQVSYGNTVATSFTVTATDNFGETSSIAATVTATATAPTRVLVDFNGTDGQYPEASLIADANGDLFGTTEEGGANNEGEVYEIANTPTGYASTPTILASFNGTDGHFPEASLIADANGDVFGTTETGGANNDGEVFEIANTATGYASSPTVLVSFNNTDGQYSDTGLIADANGDLFGTTGYGGGNNEGEVFEIANTATGYASTATVLASFSGTNGQYPLTGLIADANGDLFGTTAYGGANSDGEVFEIANTATGYASIPTILVSFNVTDGQLPAGNLIADADGDLFGTTAFGGAYGDGEVFEIRMTATGYASTPTVLVSFDVTNGNAPTGSLIADANGNLFGTTEVGGTYGEGEVFEIENTATGYASTPTILVSFNYINGGSPAAGLIADGNGDLFTTTEGGGYNGFGTVVEITNTGFVTAPPSFAGIVASQTVVSEATFKPFSTVTLTDPTFGATDTLTITYTGGGTLSGSSLLTGTAGDYTLTGSAALITTALEALTFTPAAGAPGTSTTTFNLADVSSALSARTVNTAATTTVTDIQNGAPTITAPGSVVVGVNQGFALTGGNLISVAETGITTAETFTVTLSDTHGVLNVTAASGVTGSGSTSVTIAGSLGFVNTELATLTDTDATPGSDPVKVVAVDSFGNSGTQTVAVTVNGAPAISAPGSVIAGINKGFAFTGTNLISVAESGITSSETFTVRLTDTHGALNVTAASGVTGNGGTSVAIAGSLSFVNTELASLTDTDATSGSDPLKIVTTDSLGNSGTQTVAVTVNGTPVIQVPGLQTLNMGTATSVGGISVSETGSTGVPEAFTVVLSDKNGVLAAKATAAGGGGTISAGGTTLTITGSLTQVNADLSTLTDTDTVNAPDTITVTAKDSFGNLATTQTIAVTTTETIINGPKGGFATIEGTPGNDIITAFGLFNTIYDNGGNDTVNAGAGFATVYVNTGNVAVTLSGVGNDVQGSPGAGATNGANGNDSVTGTASASLIDLGNGNDTITLTGALDAVILGGGTNNITLAGTSNSVIAGNGNNTVKATGGEAQVVLGNGTNAVTLSGNENNVTLGSGTDTVTAATGDTITLNATHLTLNGGSGAMVFISAGPSSIDDLSSGMTAHIGPASGSVSVSDLTKDTKGVIDLTGGVGGFKTVAQVIAALKSDGHGGTMLALGGSASLDFVNTSASALTAAHFRIG